MDPISKISIARDSTFAILLEAQRRGHDIFYYIPSDLTLDGDLLVADGYSIRVQDKPEDCYALGDKKTLNLAQFDVVLLRQDPPFDMAYITTTYLLERIHPKTLVINDPSHVRNAPEKLFVLDFLDLMPATIITQNSSHIRCFRERYGDIIIKPLYGNGGTGVFHLRPDDKNLNSLIEMFQLLSDEPFITQQYCHEVGQGDKRIILVDGKVAGAINRIHSVGEVRSNMHVGGHVEHAELTVRDHEICNRLGPELRKRGLLFTGIDVIGPYLTEINVTSPTGIREIMAFTGIDVASFIWDAIESKLTTT
ncbi:MAG TPA: Glutathione synthetase [Hyphomicrobiaceae bacterium MAG_BT-2024]